MKRAIQGRYYKVSTVGEVVEAFVPTPLPPSPPIDWTPHLMGMFDRAHLALGRLEGVSSLLPDPALFLYMYVRKEAVLSSMIEGTQSSLSDLLLFEQDQEPGVPLDDVQEVSNYVSALTHGLERLREGFPLSLRLIREMHAVLLSTGRGEGKSPGEFRRTQNWIGGTRLGNASFVPPPPEEVLPCMGQLEMFLHDQPEQTPSLLKAGLAHVQFETIHPFLDGNGRLGRLLITLILCEQGVLSQPLLYLSLYFKTHRRRYYELLDEVRRSGDWEAWLEFFVEAVEFTSIQAVETARELVSLAEKDLLSIEGLGRLSASARKVHAALLERPLTTAGWLSVKTGLVPATVNKCLDRLEAIGIVNEITARRRNRLFSYSRYIDILNRGLDPPG